MKRDGRVPWHWICARRSTVMTTVEGLVLPLALHLALALVLTLGLALALTLCLALALRWTDERRWVER